MPASHAKVLQNFIALSVQRSSTAVSPWWAAGVTLA
jgi:hypothetical protein